MFLQNVETFEFFEAMNTIFLSKLKLTVLRMSALMLFKALLISKSIIAFTTDEFLFV